ncbi:DedA family protein [Hippea jasoniae]|uniref:DedA family protein n=1 Tax=Hippea jasoniae TaxID=944479 RepID=UPI000A736A2D|nr:DedA family protein [Hippea jasoniae]
MSGVVEFILNAIGYGGYTGIFILMFLESSFFPFPSEVVIPPAAYLAAKGKMDLFVVILTGSMGSLAGAIFNYYLSMKLGYPFLEKYGKYVGLNKRRLEITNDFFLKHGEITTFIGRLLPAIRQYISLPAGIAKMNIVRFSIFTLLGASIWVSILAAVGYTIGNNPQLIKAAIHNAYLYIFLASGIIIFVYIKLNRRRT